MIQFNFERDKLKTMNNRRLEHWFGIMQDVMKKIQFPSIFALFQREIMEDRKLAMIASQVNMMMDHDGDQFVVKNDIAKRIKVRDQELEILE